MPAKEKLSTSEAARESRRAAIIAQDKSNSSGLSLLYYRYKLITGQYMLEPWENAIISKTI